MKNISFAEQKGYLTLALLKYRMFHDLLMVELATGEFLTVHTVQAVLNVHCQFFTN
jgi:hypothetical protein